MTGEVRMDGQFIVFFLALLLIVMLVHKVSEKSAAEEAVVSEPVKYVEKSPDFAVELLTVNEYSLSLIHI